MTKKKRVYNLQRLIIGALRKIFWYSPLRREALEKAKVDMLYKCAITKKKFPINEVTVDHIEPVVDPKIGFVDWNTFISRLFCEVGNLQVLSKKAHAEKTKREKKERANGTKRRNNAKD
jgi:hypothetical protein